MKNFFINDLLPEGFKVLLPEEAHKEESISRLILDLFFQNGYLLVKTPMMEYEDNKSQNTLKFLHNEPYLLVEPETKKATVSTATKTAKKSGISLNKPLFYAGVGTLAAGGASFALAQQQTKIFNGYEKWVSYLYKDINKESLFF